MTLHNKVSAGIVLGQIGIKGFPEEYKQLRRNAHRRYR